MRKSIMSAVFTLTLFTVLDRALGFGFKIYLSRELGAASLGLYQVALSFFFVLLTATTSGIPLVVSKMTARYRLTGEAKREGSLTAAALVLGGVIAIGICVAAVALYKPLGSLVLSGDSALVLLFLLPALVFSSVYSALRGNLWGRQRYVSVSVVEIVEQVARIIVCVILFSLGANKLLSAASSLSAGCFVSMACVIGCFIKAQGKIYSPKGEILPLLKTSTPITVSRAASSIVNSIIAVVVPFLLTSSGYAANEAMAIYGAGIGMALPLLFIPITVVGSLSFVMIPTVSEGVIKKDFARVNAQIESAIGFSIIISALFVPAFFVLGERIGTFVYDDANAGEFLSRAAWLLVPLAVENITSSVMNSLDLEIRSFFNYLIGSAVMFAFCFAFYGAFDVTVMGAGLGIGWTVTSVLHIRSIRKRTGLGRRYLIKLAGAGAMGIPTVFVTKCVYSLCSALPAVAALVIPSVLSAAFFSSLCFAFSFVDIDFFSSRVKASRVKIKNKRSKPRKRLHSDAV